MSFAVTWISLEIIIISDASHTEKDKYRIILLTCGIQKMVQMNLFAKQKQRHRCREQTYGYQGGKGGWNELGDWD